MVDEALAIDGVDDDESGWAERPVSAADQANDILEEVL
jgi:hypothetical protein